MFDFDPSGCSLLPTDPMLDSFSTSSDTHLPFMDHFPSHDLNPDSSFAQSQLPFFEPFVQPYDPPPSADFDAHLPYPATDIPMEATEYIAPTRPPLPQSQGLVDAPSDWGFAPNAFDDLIGAVDEEPAPEPSASSSGSVRARVVPNGIKVSPPRQSGGVQAVHPAGDPSTASTKKRSRDPSEQPSTAEALAATIAGLENGMGKQPETEKKKEKRKPSPYNRQSHLPLGCVPSGG